MKTRDVILTAIAGTYELNTHEDAGGDKFMCKAISKLAPSQVSKRDKDRAIRLVAKAMRKDYERSTKDLGIFTQYLVINLARIHGVDTNGLTMRQLKKQFWFDYFKIPLETKYNES